MNRKLMSLHSMIRTMFEQEVRTQVEEQQPEAYAEAIGDIDEPVVAPTTPASPFGRVEPKQEGTDRKDRTAPAARSSQRRRADS